MKFLILLLATMLAFAEAAPRRSTPTHSRRAKTVKPKRPNLKAKKVHPIRVPKGTRSSRRSARG